MLLPNDGKLGWRKIEPILLPDAFDHLATNRFRLSMLVLVLGSNTCFPIPTILTIKKVVHDCPI